MTTEIMSGFYSRIYKFLRPLVRDKKILFSGTADWFIISLFILPTYFGLRLAFFDLTALRFFEILLFIMILKNEARRNQFVLMLKGCRGLIFVGLYLFVVIYTNLIRGFALNQIFYWITNGAFVLFLAAYLVVYEYGVKGFLDKIRQCAWILSVVSPMELIIGKPPFSFLDTLNKSSMNERFGNVRIMGNCSTTNGYAMYLMILLPFICYDWENNRIDFWKNKYLIALIALNIFLTGSRLTIGTLILGLALCFIMQTKDRLLKSILALAVFIPVLVGFMYAIRNTGFGNSILATFFSAFDSVFNTNYAVHFGADESLLYGSSYYRKLLFENTILGDWLNPLFGRGTNYTFHMYIEGYDIQSCDNFYVLQYIIYAYPGLITWLAMSFSFFRYMVKSFLRKNILGYVMMVSFICYFISLWYLDHLQTFPFMMAVFGLAYALDVLYRAEQGA